MGAQRDEAVALNPPSALQTCFTAEVRLSYRTSATRRRTTRTPRREPRGTPAASRPAKPTERRPRERRAHKEQMNRRAHPRQVTCASPQSTSASTPGSCTCGMNASPTGQPIARFRPRTYSRTVAPRPRRRARDEPPPDPPRAVTLLPRRHTIRLKPRVDQRPIRPQPRRRPTHRRTLGRRQRRGQRLPHRSPMNPMTLANRRIDRPSRSRSRLICSNCSILDHIPTGASARAR